MCVYRPHVSVQVSGFVITAVIPLLLCRALLAEPVRLEGRAFDLAVPSGMCSLSEQRHKEQLDFARQVNPNKLLVLIVPCDRVGLYEPNSNASPNASLLFDSAEWVALLSPATRELLKVSGNPTSIVGSIKAGLQQELEKLNAARVNGERYPATGPELRSITIIDERRDRIFTTSITRFQRPLDRGPLDRYGASGFVVLVPYVFKFSMSSYVRNENDLLAIVEKNVDVLLKLSPL